MCMSMCVYKRVSAYIHQVCYPPVVNVPTVNSRGIIMERKQQQQEKTYQSCNTRNTLFFWLCHASCTPPGLAQSQHTLCTKLRNTHKGNHF